jgi:hypothetical protein
MTRSDEPQEKAAGPLAEFAAGLRALRRGAGDPTFAELERRTGHPAADLSEAANGRVMPSLAMTQAYVRACRGDEAEWVRNWGELHERLGSAAEQAAAAGAEWQRVTPADEWLAMASSLPSGEPLPPGEPLPSGGPLQRDEPLWSGEPLPPDGPLPPDEPLPFRELLPRSEPLPPDGPLPSGETGRPREPVSPREPAAPGEPAALTGVASGADAPATAEPAPPGWRPPRFDAAPRAEPARGAEGPGQRVPRTPGVSRGETASSRASTARPRVDENPPFPDEWVRPPADRQRRAGPYQLGTPFPPGTHRASAGDTAWMPQESPLGRAGGRRYSGHGRPRRLLPTVTGILAVFTAAAAGVIFYSHFRAPSRPSAANPTPPSHKAAPLSPRAAHSASPGAQAPASRRAAVFPAVAGVGCGTRAGTTATTGTRSQGGDGWQAVAGGLPACGGKTLTTRKTGTLGLVEDTYTWTFRTGGAATCAAQVFVADTAPSSGIARYEVFGNSLVPGTAIGQFVINQRAEKGQWVQAGTWQVHGTLRIQLTDAPNFSGDTFHVTASAAKVTCS